MKAVEILNKKMRDVINKCSGKQVILYGYGKSGIFVEWLCSHVYGKKFTLVIDDKKVIPGINLHRKIILDYVDPEQTVILDMYDTFYLYDPFRGETFKKVIKNIEESVRRKSRKVTIVYANPWLHREVEAGGIFHLTKQISTEFFLNIVNVYENK